MNKTKAYNIDCMEYMQKLPDNAFDLAIVDPPYGINRDGQSKTYTKNAKHRRKYYKKKSWDKSAPKKEYFLELFRVSANHIIWGSNYFTKYIPPLDGLDFLG